MSNSSLVTCTKISPNKTSPRNHRIDTVSIHCVVGQFTAEQIINMNHFVTYNPATGASCNYAIGKDGSIGLCVDEKDRSWCSSNRANDHRAITIEVASDAIHPYAVTNAAYQALITLLVDICKRNDIKELKWKGDKSLVGRVDKQNMTVHRWFANKACPGEYLYSRHGAIASEVNKRLGIISSGSGTKVVYSIKEFVTDVQRTFDAKVDGTAGPETLSKTITVSAILNRKHPIVWFIQKRLKALGYNSIGTIDGIAGAKFTKAVKEFQKDNKCVVDGEITARGKTWKKLLGLA